MDKIYSVLLSDFLDKAASTDKIATRDLMLTDSHNHPVWQR